MLQNITLDSKQIQLIESFKKIAETFHLIDSYKEKSKIKHKAATLINFFKSSKIELKSGGIYLYGSVGRGKTMLMKKFYDMINVEKEFIHFQSFMHEIHTKMHKLQTHNSRDKIIEDLANEIINRVKVLCIDELEIKDITDAMIIMRLFSYLSKGKVFIFLTTNTAPNDLYKDGLQRESFLPFIKNINDKFEIFNISDDKDYRLDKALNTDRKIFFPIDDQTHTSITTIKENLCPYTELRPGEFQVFGRKVVFNHTHGNILFTNFEELSMQDFGYADYVNLCRRFKIIVVENIREIKEDETDIIIRFINFIDNAYFHKILLFASLTKDPAELYPLGKRLQEFQRTISRLYEEKW